MKNTLIVLMCLLCMPAAVTAGTFTNDRYGYSIEIDDSFQMTRNDDVTFFVSEADGGAVFIRNWPGLDESTAKDYLQRGYQDERIAIVSSAEPREVEVDTGKGFLVDIRGVIERRLVKGVAGGFVGDSGQGMVVVFAAPEESWDKLASAFDQVRASIKFVDFEPAQGARDWYFRLSGTRLSLRGTGTDRRQRDDLYLCGDGSFDHRMSRAAIEDSDTGSAFGYSGRTRSGLWDVVDDQGQVRLILRYSNGRERTAVIEDRGGQIYLDGKRYRAMRNSRCR